MSTYAIVENGVVTNVIEWDGETEWVPDAGVAVLTDGTVGIGWSYAGSKFTAPPVPEPSPAELVAAAATKKQQLLDTAQSTISLWQSELLLGTISDADKASLTLWIAYIKAVQAVDTTKLPVTWPAQPES